jgi:hypothetical protein
VAASLRNNWQKPYLSAAEHRFPFPFFVDKIAW